MIIGITGPIGSGKDTVAGMLATIGTNTIAFADALRHEVALAYSLSTPDMQWFGQRDYKETPFAQLAPACCKDPDFVRVLDDRGYPRTLPMSLRNVLRLWGTEYRRAQDSGYWIERMRQRVETVGGVVVIPDVRFEDEAAYVREHGVLVHLERASNPFAAATSDHKSDRLLPVLDDDLIVRNRGALPDLAISAFSALRHCLPGVAHV